MRAVNIGICHDDDALIAQGIFVVLRPRATAERLDDIVQFLIGAHFIAAGAGNIKNLTPQRQNCLGFPVARLFSRPSSGIALNKKYFSSLSHFIAAVSQFSWQSGLTCRRFSFDLFFFTPTQTLFRPLQRVRQKQIGRGRIRR